MGTAETRTGHLEKIEKNIAFSVIEILCNSKYLF